MMSRRHLLRTGGLTLAGLAAPAVLRYGRAAPVERVAMRSNREGSRVWFDPVGLWVAPGTTIRWTIAENVHTVTAYHPDNDNHSLRIPEAAAPFDSDYLVNPGDRFEITLSEPGTYDYFCAPHEQGGMVGRIIVGMPGGPGSQPFDYFAHQNPRPDWLEVPKATRANFPSIKSIMENRVVRNGG